MGISKVITVFLGAIFLLSSCKGTRDKTFIDKVEDLYFKAHVTNYHSIEVISRMIAEDEPSVLERDIDFQYHDQYGKTVREKVTITTVADRTYFIENKSSSNTKDSDLAAVEVRRLIRENKVKDIADFRKLYGELEVKYRSLLSN